MAFDIVVVLRRTDATGDSTERYRRGDIISVYPIDKDPGPGASIHPRHAVVVIRDVPGRSLKRVRDLFTQENYIADDVVAPIRVNRRRWQVDVASLPTAFRNKLANDGYADVSFTAVKAFIKRKAHGVTPARDFVDADIA